MPRRRIGAGERPGVAHLGPLSPGARRAGVEHRYGRVVGMNALGGEDVARIASTSGIRVAADAPTQSARVDTSSATPSRA